MTKPPPIRIHSIPGMPSDRVYILPSDLADKLEAMPVCAAFTLATGGDPWPAERAFLEEIEKRAKECAVIKNVGSEP